MNLSNQPKCISLKAKNEISEVLNNGLKVKTKLGPVFLLKKSGSAENKAAVLLKKTTGKAFYRNYIKRIIRYYIRTEFTLFDKFNRVIFLYSGLPRTDYAKLKKNYNDALKRA